MRLKNDYTKPYIQVLAIGSIYGTMETISLPIGSTPASGGGDAKGGFFDDVEDEEIATAHSWSRTNH